MTNALIFLIGLFTASAVYLLLLWIGQQINDYRASRIIERRLAASQRSSHLSEPPHRHGDRLPTGRAGVGAHGIVEQAHVVPRVTS